ncbi:hypothetical protein [Streptomyces swartbergensis]|uniref:hypothetical protein n=1 Tax=Streptomyces swartbergensis TaxID=487165 RepID=UPI0038205F25
MPQAEWGGFGRSGVGRELGPTGVREYQEAKHIYQNLPPAPSGWFKGGTPGSTPPARGTRKDLVVQGTAPWC